MGGTVSGTVGGRVWYGVWMGGAGRGKRGLGVRAVCRVCAGGGMGRLHGDDEADGGGDAGVVVVGLRVRVVVAAVVAAVTWRASHVSALYPF